MSRKKKEDKKKTKKVVGRKAEFKDFVKKKTKKKDSDKYSHSKSHKDSERFKKENSRRKKRYNESSEDREKFEKSKQKVVEVMQTPVYQPMRLRELAMLLGVSKKDNKKLYAIIDSLVEEHRIAKDEDGRYELQAGDYKEGTFVGHPKGFGFVEIEGEEQDIFIPEGNTNQAVHSDKVQILISDKQTGKRPEGIVVKILERGITEIVGTYEKSSNYGFVVSDNAKFSKDVFIPKEYTKDAVNGDKVVAKITSYGSANKSPEGKIEEILGNLSDPGTDILAIVKSAGIPTEFPERVMNQAERVPEALVPGDYTGREDLRDWTIVTIDGEDAKDLDDGVSLTYENGVYHLGVHIADVSNYVQGGSALDKEALKRATSVYLVDRVIPMLPKRLSNGICSLNQGVDRLALSCLMEIGPRGGLKNYRIVESVINVNRRMTYTNVKKILERSDEEVLDEYKELVPTFDLMAKLSSILRKKRHTRGAIDFDFPESKILLNKAGKPVDIFAYEHNIATKVIEDFMLMANETVAMEYSKLEIPFVYRTHDNPDEEKVENLLTFLHAQGVEAQKAKEKISPKEIQKILKGIEGSPSEAMISRMTLRTMKQARYTTDCSGHFGLAAQYYCHFTSPIRRYPDLQIHRIIKEHLRGKMTRERQEFYAERLEEVAGQSSAMERRAEEAERNADKLKMAEYMQSHIGEEYEGIISSVTGWGLYVELPNTVEGLVHVNSMRDDFYNFDQEKFEMVGEATKKVYAMGQKVKVRVADADTYLKTIDFTLVN